MLQKECFEGATCPVEKIANVRLSVKITITVFARNYFIRPSTRRYDNIKTRPLRDTYHVQEFTLVFRARFVIGNNIHILQIQRFLRTGRRCRQSRLREGRELTPREQTLLVFEGHRQMCCLVISLDSERVAGQYCALQHGRYAIAPPACLHVSIVIVGDRSLCLIGTRGKFKPLSNNKEWLDAGREAQESA